MSGALRHFRACFCLHGRRTWRFETAHLAASPTRRVSRVCAVLIPAHPTCVAAAFACRLIGTRRGAQGREHFNSNTTATAHTSPLADSSLPRHVSQPAMTSCFVWQPSGLFSLPSLRLHRKNQPRPCRSRPLPHVLLVSQSRVDQARPLPLD
jgi:hypothetical protein